MYAQNEENMLNFEGSLVSSKDRVTVLISELEDDDAMIISAHISSAETNAVDECVL